MVKKELKKTTLTRYCFYCGKLFEAVDSKNIFHDEFCEFKNWKEATRAKSLRGQRKRTKLCEFKKDG